MDPLRGVTQNITTVNKTLLKQGGAYLRQVYILNTDVDNESKVELYDGVNTSATELKFKTLIPKQIDQSLITKIFDGITRIENKLRSWWNEHIIGTYSLQDIIDDTQEASLEKITHHRNEEFTDGHNWTGVVGGTAYAEPATVATAQGYSMKVIGSGTIGVGQKEGIALGGVVDGESLPFLEEFKVASGSDPDGRSGIYEVKMRIWNANSSSNMTGLKVSLCGTVVDLPTITDVMDRIIRTTIKVDISTAANTDGAFFIYNTQTGATHSTWFVEDVSIMEVGRGPGDRSLTLNGIKYFLKEELNNLTSIPAQAPTGSITLGGVSTGNWLPASLPELLGWLSEKIFSIIDYIPLIGSAVDLSSGFTGSGINRRWVFYDAEALFSGMDYSPNTLKYHHDHDTEMAYDRNQGYVIEFPSPGIHFQGGIVAKVYDEDNSSVARDTSITCIYQESATGASGGTIKSVYSEGSANGAWGGETVINQPCLLHSIHFFNNATQEQGLRLYEGREAGLFNEIVNFKAGDNSLHQIYFPKPGFIFNPALYYKTDYATSPERLQVTFVYEEL